MVVVAVTRWGFVFGDGVSAGFLPGQEKELALCSVVINDAILQDVQQAVSLTIFIAMEPSFRGVSEFAICLGSTRRTHPTWS
jgi:hypothetical protein